MKSAFCGTIGGFRSSLGYAWFALLGGFLLEVVFLLLLEDNSQVFAVLGMVRTFADEIAEGNVFDNFWTHVELMWPESLAELAGCSGDCGGASHGKLGDSECVLPNLQVMVVGGHVGLPR
jgi:hypothetical protein